MEQPVNFRDFFETHQMDESKIFSGLKKGAIVGALGDAAAAPFFLTRDKSATAPVVQDDGAPASAIYIPPSKELANELRAENNYYTPDTDRKLMKMAHEGDEWAIREIAWPEKHKFHKRGRPFFRNDGPHPKRLIPYHH